MKTSDKTRLTDVLETYSTPGNPVDYRTDHGLRLIWHQIENNNVSVSSTRNLLSEKIDSTILDDLARDGLIEISGDTLNLSKYGHAIAKDIVRRKRLAERLLHDVLNVAFKEVESQANEFEHILDKNVEESICTLLGHPRECPHGYPIPPGECCLEKESELHSIVSSLDQFSPGECGKVAYILTRDHPLLHKLMSLGIVPGTAIHIHQISPSFIIKVEETQLALEKEVAGQIYLRRIQE